MIKTFGLAGLGVALSTALLIGPMAETPRSDLAQDYRQITLLATNDIHGAVESSTNKNGEEYGGLAFWGGAVQAIREGLKRQHGDRAGVLLLDGGDQFQGTLISNFNEGRLVYSIMDQLGYDAIVPGNHAYDFGPQGWLEDQVTEETTDKNPRGALERAVDGIRFPLLSANTYYSASIRNAKGAPVKVDGVGCAPEAKDTVIDWSQARRPELLKSHLIRETAGVKVALIGIDHAGTPKTTTASNVADLCFRDEADAYLDLVTELQEKGAADLFVMVIHNGNTSTYKEVSGIVEKIIQSREGALHAVVAGHTHMVNNETVQGVPIIQSGSSSRMFGRIDLVWDRAARQLVSSRTRSFAGVWLNHGRCDEAIESFCQVERKGDHAVIQFEGVAVRPDAQVEALIKSAREELAPVADRKLGRSEGELTRDRISESSLANAMTDALRTLSSAEVAILNTGGLRTNMRSGEFTYSDLFEVLPFGNRAVVVGPMPAEKLLSLLTRSVKTCGKYGALMQSGLRVEFERDCKNRAKDDLDDQARVVRVETLSGEVILDLRNGAQPPQGKVFQVATLDFRATGGSGYDDFIGTPVARDLGIFRESLTEAFLKEPARFSSELDGRWKEVVPAQAD